MWLLYSAVLNSNVSLWQTFCASDGHLIQEIRPVFAPDVFNHFLIKSVGFLRVVVPLISVFGDVNFIKPAIFKADYDAVIIAAVIETGILFMDVIRNLVCSVTVQIPHHIVWEVYVRQELKAILIRSVLK